MALAAAVAAGALDGVDRAAREHAAPLKAGPEGRGRDPALRALADLVDAVRLPASPLAAAAAFAGGCLVLWRRGARRAAVLWALVLPAGLTVEVASKATIDRGPVAGPQVHDLGGFELGSTFPSGHAMRAVLLAAFAAYLWPPFRRVALAWAAAMPVLIHLNGGHLLSDVTGGVLAGLALALAVAAAGPGPRWPPGANAYAVGRRQARRRDRGGGLSRRYTRR